MSDATIEVDGEVYELTHAAIRDNTQTYAGSRGERYTMRIGSEWLAVQLSTEGWDFPKRFSDDPFPCRVHVPGRDPVTGNARVMGFGAGLVSLHIHDLKPIPATPTLDEHTDPADLDWGTIRSTCAARDWRAAWGVVGTDHTGDATPGEVYLLAVARRASATAAALHHWRQAEMESGTIFVGADAAQAWQRIKRIAAWESSARAQYDEAAAHRERMRLRRTTAHGFSLTVDGQPIGISSSWNDAATQARLYGRGAASIDDSITITPEWAASHDRLADLLQAAMPAGLSLGYRTAEDDAVTRGNGGVPGMLNNPYLTAAAQHGEITGTVTIQPSASDLIPWQRPDTNARATWHVGIAIHPTNPAPRGPQTRKRR